MRADPEAPEQSAPRGTRRDGGGDLVGQPRTALGTVRWFNPDKGFGFLVTDQAEDEVFVHYSAIAGQGWRTLQAGARVRFELELGPRGPRAVRVEVLASGANDARPS